MRKLSVLVLAAVGVFAVSTLASAAPSGNGRPAVPPGAARVSENVYYLGTQSVDGVELEGYAFVHRAKTRLNARGTARPNRCYRLIGYPPWATAEPWLVDDSSAPLPGMASMMDAGVGAWEGAAGADIFGNGEIDTTYDAGTRVDGKNGAEFAPIIGPGIVAVTYVWGARKVAVYEWDTMFNSNYDWADGSSPGSFDFLSVATHELGHAAGLEHPSGCTEETMYEYIDFGETKKRTLNTGDIAGINVLY